MAMAIAKTENSAVHEVEKVNAAHISEEISIMKNTELPMNVPNINRNVMKDCKDIHNGPIYEYSASTINIHQYINSNPREDAQNVLENAKITPSISKDRKANIDSETEYQDKSTLEEQNVPKTMIIEEMIQKDQENKCHSSYLRILSNYNITENLSPPSLQPCRKWRVLFLISALCLVQSLIDITWNTIADSAKSVYNFHKIDFAAFINFRNLAAYGIIYRPLFDNKGSRRKVLIIAGLVFFGAGFRCISFHESDIKKSLVSLGQASNGVAGFGITFVPYVLSVLWFPTKQHSMAISVPIFCRQMGLCLGFLLGPLVLDGLHMPPCYNERLKNSMLFK